MHGLVQPSVASRWNSPSGPVPMNGSRSLPVPTVPRRTGLPPFTTENSAPSWL